jgi:4-amino-4-deoxy-L-arabinose transferase-like glycosyltransferase
VKWLAAALAALTLLRLAIAAITPLAPDEAYYWVWSQALAAGYPDHPPMVALWIRAGTLLAGDGALGVRLLGPLSAALASLLLIDAGERLLPGRQAGWWAAALLNASLLFGIGTVVMTPDAPLLFFWTCCLWAIARWLHGSDDRWWLAIGLFAGLAMVSKYTAVFLWLGIVLWLLAVPALRRCWLRPMPWLGAALGIAVFLPVLLWNATHGWASFARQGGRVADFQPDRAVRFLAELLAGQIGLMTPLVFLLCAAGVALAWRQAWRTRDAAWTLLAALTLPATAVFTQHAFGDRVQGNWPAIIYPAAAVAAAGLSALRWRRLFQPAIALGLAITALVYAQAWFAPFHIPPGVDPIALRLAGWDRLAVTVDTARRDSGADFVAVDQYGVAAELARGLPAPVPVIGVEPRWAWFNLPSASLAGRVGILVRSARRDADFDRSGWASVTELTVVARGAAEQFRLYRVVGPAVTPDAVVLPRPASDATAPSTSASE